MHHYEFLDKNNIGGKMMNTFSIVMAGGDGTRFWPLSRQCKPKQLLNLSGSDIMINETIKRNSPLIPIENTYVVTNQSQGIAMKDLLLKDVKPKNILLEPVGRNTAACIAFAAAKISKQHGDSVMCIFPSDAYINKDEEYFMALKKAIKHVSENDSFVVLGITPTFAANGYGYIKYNNSNPTEEIFSVEDFIEKPNTEKAKSYLKSGNYLWNSGILICRSSVMLENIRRFLPKLGKQLEILSTYFDTKKEFEMIQSIYPSLQSISVDYGILERSDDVMVIPGDFGWNDVGSWDMLGVVIPPDENGNIIKAEHLGIDTKNTIIYGDKLITTIGLENMIVVNTNDALLICPKSRAQEVKNIVDLLNQTGKMQYL
jgi:mannose-1-phosphate guanylyltransferase